MLQLAFSDEKLLLPPHSPAYYVHSPPPLTSSFPFSYVPFPNFPVVFLGKFCLSSYALPVKEKNKVAFKNKIQNSKLPNNFIQISPT